MLDPIPPQLMPLALRKWPDLLEGSLLDLLALGASGLLQYGPFYNLENQTGHLSLKPYLDATPAELLRAAPAAARPDLTRVGETPGHVEYAARVPSPYQPFHPLWTPMHLAAPENHFINLRVFEPKGVEPTMAILFLHGWSMGHLDEVKAMEPWAFFGGEPVRLVLMDLPFHMERKPDKSAFSGEFFVSGNLPRSVEAVIQAVSDVTGLLGWLKNDCPHVGLLGGSLGGFLASLTVTQTDLMDFAVLLYPATSLTVLLENPVMGSVMSEGLRRSGYSLEDAQQLGRMLSPLSHAPQLPPERLLMIAGLADQVIAPKHALMLHEHFGHPPLHWYGGGHAGLLQPRYRRWMAKHIRLFLNRENLLLAA